MTLDRLVQARSDGEWSAARAAAGELLGWLAYPTDAAGPGDDSDVHTFAATPTALGVARRAPTDRPAESML